MAFAHAQDQPAPRAVPWLPRAFAWVAHAPRAVPPPALVLLGIVSVQVGAAVAKQLFTSAGPAGVVTLRLVFAAAVLLAVWPPLRRRRLDARTLALVGAFGVVLSVMNLAFYQAIARIPLGVAVTIEFLGPLVVALAGSRRRLDVMWAVLAAAGVYLLANGGSGHLTVSGVLFAALAAVCWAGYIVLSAAVGQRTEGGSGLALASVVAAAVVTPFGVAEAGATLLEPAVLLLGLGVALASSAIPYSLELEALRRMPPRVFGVLMSLEPAVAALVGLVVLGELLAPGQWLGICAVVGASAGAARGTGGGADSPPADGQPPDG